MSGTKYPATAIVVGNGVVGLSVAIALQRAGSSITLVGPQAPWRGASWGNAGHIAVEQVEPLASLATIRSAPRRLFSRGGALALPPREIATWLPFALRMMRASTPRRFAHGKAALSAALACALPAWRRLLADADGAELLREDGHFVLWEHARSAVHGRAHWAAADIGTTSLRDATAAEIGRLGALTDVPIAGAIRFAGSGQIVDPAALGDVLATRFASLGGRFRHGRVQGIAPGASVVLDDGDTLHADVAVIAAGTASAQLVSTAGLRAPLIAERGYHVEWDAPASPPGMPPVVFEDRSMIVTRFATTLRVASFVEFANGQSPPDPRKWARLRAHVTALGLGVSGMGREWMGARPTLPDYLPAIGISTREPSIAYAFGHQHLGLTLAAATGEALAALLCEAPVPFDLTPFDLCRFE